MKTSVVLPNRVGSGENEVVEAKNHLVIIGANGSGKTRLGSWIETTMQAEQVVHRIAAQRALTIPDYAQIKSLSQADRGLLYGTYEEYGGLGRKLQDRWGGSPETHMLDDYGMLLTNLFARTTKRDADHTRETKERKLYVPVENAPIDTIQEVWKDVMPQREIEFTDGKIMVRKTGTPQYHGKQMSDGERVALYLIGQCLCAAKGSVIIIDEPELHLHKSLMARLWDKIESLCPDKAFVYITHDLDFAASRKAATKIWIKSYEDSSWIWDIVPEVDEIPESVTIEILGNRKNVLFTEGERGSYDSVIYQAVFPGHHVIPRGNCEKVIESTKAIRSTPAIHHVKAFGIIDVDYRTPEELQALKDSGVHAIEVAEVENLLCVEPLLRMVASVLHKVPDDLVATVTDFVAKALQDEFEVQVTSHAEREIQFRLNAYSKSGHTEQGLVDAYAAVTSSVDVRAIWAASRVLYEKAVADMKLHDMLKLYNRKSLHRRIASLFGLKDAEYAELILRMLKSDQKDHVVAALRPFMPVLD